MKRQPLLLHQRIPLLVDQTGHVGQVLNKARGQRGPVEAHIAGVPPLVQLLVVALDVVSGADAVEASDHDDHVVDDLDGEIAAGGQHVRRRRPRFGGGVEAFDGAQPYGAVEAAQNVDHGVVGDAGDATAPEQHWRQQRPLVYLGVEDLGCVQALDAIKAACNEATVISFEKAILSRKKALASFILCFVIEYSKKKNLYKTDAHFNSKSINPTVFFCAVSYIKSTFCSVL